MRFWIFTTLLRFRKNSLMTRRVELVVLAFIIAIAVIELFYQKNRFLLMDVGAQRVVVTGESIQGTERLIGGRSMYDPDDRQNPYILCFGDSFVYSLYMPDTQTLPCYLQVYLNGGKLGGHYRVVNYGAPGTTISHHYETYLGMGRYPEKHIVLLFYGQGDISEVGLQAIKTKKMEFNPKIMVAADYLSRSVVMRQGLNKYYQKISTDYSHNVPYQRARMLYKYYFNQFIEGVRSRKGRCAMIMIAPELKDRQYVSDLCREKGIPYYQQEFSMRFDDPLYRFVDGHLSRFGNRRMAEEVARFLSSLGWISRSDNEK